MRDNQIKKICAREILDSRGTPTVEACVTLECGITGVASVPSGASTGQYEAYELRDGNNRFNGRGVLCAVSNITKKISPALEGVNVCCTKEIDTILCELDGSKNKKNLGANAILAVSLACAKAAANFNRIPLYRYIGGANTTRLPIPMMNVLNGGAHATNNIDIQEFMIVPTEASCFSEGIRIGCEIYQILKNQLKKKSLSSAVGDEGGFAPNISSDEEAILLLCEAIDEAGYSDKVKIALDVASSEWYDGKNYKMPKRGIEMTSQGMIDYLSSLCNKYPICSIEDGLAENDDEGWVEATDILSDKIMLVGDDYFVTDKERLKHGIDIGAANAILIKPNQIGTLSETLDAINLAKYSGYRFIPSHRSGDTEDSSLADLAVATGAMFIKSGAPCRSERLAKYNRLLRIEASLGICAEYGTYF